MDVFTPAGASNGLAVVDVASGMWYSDRGKINDHKEAQMFDIFCGRGYTVFAVRPGSITKFSLAEMSANVKKGVQWVKAHAAEYKVDPKRIALIGESAGAHLVAWIGTQKDPETSVAAVVPFYSPGDLELQTNRLVILDVRGTPVIRQWHVAHLAKKRLSPTAVAFKEFVLEHGRDLLQAQAADI